MMAIAWCFLVWEPGKSYNPEWRVEKKYYFYVRVPIKNEEPDIFAFDSVEAKIPANKAFIEFMIKTLSGEWKHFHEWTYDYDGERRGDTIFHPLIKDFKDKFTFDL